MARVILLFKDLSLSGFPRNKEIGGQNQQEDSAVWLGSLLSHGAIYLSLQRLLSSSRRYQERQVILKKGSNCSKQPGKESPYHVQMSQSGWVKSKEEMQTIINRSAQEVSLILMIWESLFLSRDLRAAVRWRDARTRWQIPGHPFATERHAVSWSRETVLYL